MKQMPSVLLQLAAMLLMQSQANQAAKTENLES